MEANINDYVMITWYPYALNTAMSGSQILGVGDVSMLSLLMSPRSDGLHDRYSSFQLYLTRRPHDYFATDHHKIGQNSPSRFGDLILKYFHLFYQK